MAQSKSRVADAKCESKHVHDDSGELLRAAKLKVTRPRTAILDILAAEHGPFTSEEIHAAVTKSSGLACDLVTIYRCLAKFEELGLISRCDFGDGAIRYELHRKDHHHHHIICRSCRRVEPLPDCPVETKVIRLPKLSFKDVTHRLEFFGLCPDCQLEIAKIT